VRHRRSGFLIDRAAQHERRHRHRVGIEHVQPHIIAFEPFRDRGTHLAEAEESHVHVPPPVG